MSATVTGSAASQSRLATATRCSTGVFHGSVALHRLVAVDDGKVGAELRRQGIEVVVSTVEAIAVNDGLVGRGARLAAWAPAEAQVLDGRSDDDVLERQGREHAVMGLDLGGRDHEIAPVQEAWLPETDSS